MRLSLPIILRRPCRPFLYAGYWLPYILVYQAINRFPIFDPQVLPLSRLDQTIPFLPALLPLYIAYIPFYWWTGVRAENDKTASMFFYSTHFQLLICGLIWMAFPIAMPREIFYPPEAFGFADAFWRWFDPPNNCLPSLHAANCLLFIKFNWRRRARWTHTLFAAAITVSTVLVKQHYLADVLAGGAVFLLTVFFMRSIELVEVERLTRSEGGMWQQSRALGGAQEP